MLNFAEQTGSGAVIVVWSFLPINEYLIVHTLHIFQQQRLLSRYALLFDWQKPSRDFNPQIAILGANMELSWFPQRSV